MQHLYLLVCFHFVCSNMMTVVDTFQFYTHVMVDWLEHPEKSLELKNTLSQILLLTLLCTQFITAALAAHGYQKTYIMGPTSRPCMWVSWSGLVYFLTLVGPHLNIHKNY